jgi:adenine-specific DNA methylase
MAQKNRRERLKIEDEVPIKTVGIETERERTNYSDLPPQNYIHIWWARRPTPATRLAVLGSILPDSVDDDTFLRWLGINPSNKHPDHSVSEHVIQKKKTEDDRDGALYDHFGYRKSYKNLPDKQEREKIHNLARETWGGELPTVLDATAGGGSIPFESLRYEFPTIANELNPVASIVLKSVLEHPRVNGDLSSDIRNWGERINSQVRENLEGYFPSKQWERPLEYLWAHTQDCPDCGLSIPLSTNWWLSRDSSREGIAAKPEVADKEDKVTFEIVELPNDVEKSEFDPTEGTISYGKATCPRCNVVIEGEDLREEAQTNGFGYQLYAVHIEDQRKKEEKRYFRTPKDRDINGFDQAQDKVQNDPELSTFLDLEIPPGSKTDEPRRYGLTRWRELYTDRQLLLHHAYLNAFEDCKEEIEEKYEEPVADAILTFLAIAADKAVNYNCRLSYWDSSVPKLAHAFSRHDLAFSWSFPESNLLAEGLGYDWILDSTVEVYEELRELSGHSSAPSEVLQGDAANLDVDTESVQTIVLDPPYYDNVMYAELSDFFYVWLKEYLGDTYPEFFTQTLTEKHDEAVANPAKFDDVAGEGQSKQEMAKDDYESKMVSIFEELHRVLDEDGVFTLMFTHKKTEAWDTLTTALIESGFVVKSTNPVSTESPNSLHQAGKNAAESTILLTSEKREEDSQEYTLWDDVKDETWEVARAKARDLDQREVEFTKVDMILASFGPTLRVFTENYPVVDDEGNEIQPQKALDEARNAVNDYLIDNYLNDGVQDVDSMTEWYILSWLVFEAERFPYDEARRLAIGVGEDLNTLKKTHRMWRKRSGDVLLRPHSDRVRDINKDEDARSGRKPVDPDALSFATALDKVHAAMHVYDVKGATEAWNWMNDRNCGSDPAFKATLEALLRVIPHDHSDWELARDIAAGETGELLDLDLDADIFKEDEEEGEHQGSLNDF